VADGRDDGHDGCADGARQLLLVEGPEVFGRAAAAPDDDDVDALFAAPLGERALVEVVQEADGLTDFGARPLALDARRGEEHVDRARAAREHRQDVADGRAGRRSHHADAAREERQRPLQLLVEEALGRQPVAQLLEGDAQRARAHGVQGFDDQLVLAARLVDGEAAARAHL
jgi:hypothetical protein